VSRPAPAFNLSGREAAAAALQRALHRGEFASEHLRRLREEGRLEQREAALAVQIALCALRHALTIDHILSRVAAYDRRRVPLRLRVLLYTAACQIIWMNRIPEFAAVDEAVELARRRVGRAASTMVNAVLRSLTGAMAQQRTAWQRLNARQVRVSWGQACAFGVDVLPAAQTRADRLAHLAVATGLRRSHFRRWVQRYGEQAAEAAAWASQAVPPIVVHRNPLRVEPDSFAAGVQEAFGEMAVCTADVAFLPGGANVAALPLLRQGGAFVQDVTAHRAALAVGAQPGERILDLCAAPGGKAVALALQMQDRGQVIACDTVRERLARVAENAARMGLSCIHTRHLPQDAEARPPADLHDACDAALVDVPCANTGVLARRPEARFGLTPVKLRSLARLQGRLLRRAAACVRPGGRLVYSTCSLEPEENEQIVAAFVRQPEPPQSRGGRTWQTVSQETALPAWGARLADWRDGGYTAVLRRAPM